MTAEQRKLARHALGLPNKTGVSYRNRYIAGPECPHAFSEWMAMRTIGEARFCADEFFWLTAEGALAALNPGEKLCAEDFPFVPAASNEVVW